VAKQLGHTDIRTVSQTYGHIAEQFREEQVRKRFSPLDDVEIKNASNRADELDAIWQELRTNDWRAYAPVEASSERRIKSSVRTPKEVLKVFEQGFPTQSDP
jgi:hypothetical protein